MKTSPTLRSSLLLIPFSLSLIGNTQNVAINATGNQADPSAMLDVSSQTAGVLIPRMSTATRNAISSPATGLQIFNTDCNELNFWNGVCWISTGSLPTPGAITSNNSTALCAAVTSTYSIAAVTGATAYVWQVPAGATINSGQGTTSVSVTLGNYSGEVCVRAYDACETGNPMCLDINISPIPSTPGNITGLATVSPGQSSVSYFIASVSGAGVYNWSVPAGATIVTGVGTPAITVNYSCSAVSGNVSVTAGSNCGNSSPASLAVSVIPLSVNAGSAVLGGSAIGGSPTASAGQTPYVYSWSPNSNLSGYTVANPTALCSGSSTTYTITVTDAGGCTATGSVAVTRNLAANAGSVIFGGSALSGSATGGVSPYAYSWSPNSNLSGYTVANPTALCSGSTTTYTLTVTDAHGCTATSGVTVTRNLIANAGSAVLVGAALSGSATGGVSPYSYSWTPNSNLSGYAVANPSALCSGSTTTYTLTVMDANGCAATSSVVVTNNLTANAGSNMSICTGGSTAIGPATATGGNSNSYTYSWSPSTGLSSTTIANPTANPASTTIYTVTVTDANGCTATNSMTLTLSSGTHGSQTFSYTGSQQTFTVPTCISIVTIQAYGAQGQSGNNNASGGLGGSATGTLSVSPGNTLYIYVGGESGYNGGGSAGYGNGNGGLASYAGSGGGGSDVRLGGTSFSNVVIDAGGGGGGGNRYYNGGFCCGVGTGNGGAGGGTTGGTGANGGGGSGSSGNGGLGGTQNAGGTGGSGGSGCGNGSAGSQLQGGAGVNGYYNVASGGGGGGYYGGGGGETACQGSGGDGGGGGGGSSYLGGVSNSSTSSGVQSGNGEVVITY